MNRAIVRLKITLASLSIIGLGVTASSGQDIPVSRSFTIVKDIPNIVSRPVTIARDIPNFVSRSVTIARDIPNFVSRPVTIVRDIPNVVSRSFTLAFCPAGEDLVGEPDCNDNGLLDICEIANCTGEPGCSDCNGNDVPDECDIADGTSQDDDANGIPDECEPSCGNGSCDQDEDTCNCPEDCGTPPPGEVVGSTCTDTVDNDCDAVTDCRDPDCRDEVDCAGIRDCNDNGIVDSDERLKRRAFCIPPCSSPCSNGAEWSLRIDWEGAGPNFTELNCPAVPISGSTRADMAQGLVDCINGVVCPSITAVHIAPPCLIVSAPAAPVRICVGLAGLTPDCCVSAGLTCSFNPHLAARGESR